MQAPSQTYVALRFSLPLVAVWLVAAVSPNRGLAEEPFRIWVDFSGTHSVEAQLVRRNGNEVTLARRDGGTVTIAVESLSKKDRDYLEAYLRRQTQAPNPLRTRPPVAETPAPLPEPQLPPARSVAAEASPLQLSDPTPPTKPSRTAAPIDPDPAPNGVVKIRECKVAIPGVDLYDSCSRPIVLLPNRSPGEAFAKLALSVSQINSISNVGSRSRLLRVDTDAQQCDVVWEGNQTIRLFDHHADSDRGLVLVGFDALGGGGQLAVANGWDRDSVDLKYRRTIGRDSPVGRSPQVRWARWVDDQHLVAVVDETLGMWNLVSGKQIYRFDELDGRSLPAISPGRHYVAVPSADGVVIRQCVDGTPIGRVPVEENRRITLAFSPLGNALAISVGRRMRVWDLPSATLAADMESKHRLGNRQPAWVGSDMLLSSSGVVMSVFRGRPIRRYSLVGARSTSAGKRTVIFRKHPDPEIRVITIPPSSANGGGTAVP